MISNDELTILTSRCRELPPAKQSYLVDDFIENLLLTVVDFQMHTTAVQRAHDHFRIHRQREIQSLDELKRVMARYTDDRNGNTGLAQCLWGYKLWTRAGLLRRLAEYFESVGVTSQAGLRAWAVKTSFKNDFQGKIMGLGLAVYNWLVMRQGVETVKPDVHIRRFVETAAIPGEAKSGQKWAWKGLPFRKRLAMLNSC